MTRLTEVAAYFLNLGLTAFGGPAAHVAMMHDEVVKRRRWLTDQEFLDLLGAVNLIPGPNSTEMAIHIGYKRAGWPGLIAGGVCFILPAMLIVMGLAWLYVRHGSAPETVWIMYGIKPVVIAIICQALWDLGRKAVKGPLTAVVGLAVIVLYFTKVNELALLFAGGLVVMAVKNFRRFRPHGLKSIFLPLSALSVPAVAVTAFSLPILFLTFLKIGSVLYGSGYVLFAFLQADFVTRLGWLTDRQLIDAIAIGQVTPGPVFTTATFIGYILGGATGAVLATIAIFLPSFVFVAVSYPFVPKLRASAWFSGLLDGVTVASLALMAGVTWVLGRSAVVDPVTFTAALASLVLLVRFKVDTTFLIAAGALIGLGNAIIQGWPPLPPPPLFNALPIP